MKRLVLSAALILFASPVFASSISQSDIKATESESSRTELSRKEVSQAKAWGLKESDWTRYKEIMSGRRGTWSPGLDPVTALGVDAETEDERRRYAEILVMIEHERVEKELAFETARMEAFEKLYGHQPRVNNKPFIESFKNRKKENAQRLVMFVSPTCTDCDTLIPNFYNSVGQNGRLDIYVRDASEEDIRLWAAEKQIPPDLVQQSVVTLNQASFKDMLQLGVTGTKTRVFQIDGTGNIQELPL